MIFCLLFFMWLTGPVSWGYRITTASVQDMTLNNLMVRLQYWGNTEFSFMAIAPLWPGVVVPGRVLSMGQIKQNSILMQN